MRGPSGGRSSARTCDEGTPCLCCALPVAALLPRRTAQPPQARRDGTQPLARFLYTDWDCLPSRAAAAGKLKAALAGLDASKKMHDYLTNQQRRKEEYWLRKYGKILAPPPQRIQSERSHGHLPPIANNNTASVPRRRHRSGNPALSGSDRASQPGALRQPHPDRRHNVSNLQYHPMAPVQLPPLQSLPPPSKEPSGAMPSVITSARTQELSATAFTATQPAQAGPTIAVAADGTAAVLGAEASKASDLGIQGSSLAAETSLSVLPGFRSGPVMHVAPHTNAVHHQQQQQQQHASAPPYHQVGPRVVTHNRGMRDLQLELAVLKVGECMCQHGHIFAWSLQSPRLHACFSGRPAQGQTSVHHVRYTGSPPVMRTRAHACMCVCVSPCRQSRHVRTSWIVCA